MAQAIETHEMPESVEEGVRRGQFRTSDQGYECNAFLPICYSIHCSTNAYDYH